MDLELEGKRAIVTGGSRGIGKVIARTLTEEGVDVVIAARPEETLNDAAAELASETGKRVIPIAADTGDDASATRMVAEARERLGGVDILVNGATYPIESHGPASIADLDITAMMADLNIKVAGYLRVAQAVAPGMVEEGWGRIINIGGKAAHMVAGYTASIRCAAISPMTKNLADELGPKGVNCVAINPGLVRTEKSTPEREKLALDTNTINRLIEPIDIAWLVTVLASPNSVAMNGATVLADGGMPKEIRY